VHGKCEHLQRWNVLLKEEKDDHLQAYKVSKYVQVAGCEDKSIQLLCSGRDTWQQPNHGQHQQHVLIHNRHIVCLGVSNRRRCRTSTGFGARYLE
jgi:hypothetical protein